MPACSSEPASGNFRQCLNRVSVRETIFSVETEEQLNVGVKVGAQLHPPDHTALPPENRSHKYGGKDDKGLERDTLSELWGCGYMHRPRACWAVLLSALMLLWTGR